MWIALTGTPGTGKTSVGRLLKVRNYIIVDLNEIIRQNNFVLGRDDERDTLVADLDSLSRHLEENYGEYENVILEGHIAHNLQVDVAIVLRCKPTELEKRLRDRGYPPAKISENVEAEAIDVIMIEAVEALGRARVREIDVTILSIEEVTEAVEKILAGDYKNYEVGSIDWSDYLMNK
jgi:adenylate kinase